MSETKVLRSSPPWSLATSSWIWPRLESAQVGVVGAFTLLELDGRLRQPLNVLSAADEVYRHTACMGVDQLKDGARVGAT